MSERGARSLAAFTVWSAVRHADEIQLRLQTVATVRSDNWVWFLEVFAVIDRYVLGLDEIDQTQSPLVGGKGANLGELSRIEGVRVPAGFCVTTDAFRRIMTRRRR